MRKILLSALTLSLAGVVVFISCKKELSCEGCGNGNNSANKSPTAIAGPDQSITLPNDNISLDGSASNDPDGTISEWLWKKIEGPASFTIVAPNDSVTLVKNLVAGTYRFELSVKDDGGLSAKDTVEIPVNYKKQPNRPPVANAGADQAITLPSNTINLNGSGSTDPDNNISSYTWTKISGPSSFNIANANAIQTQVNNLIHGTYQFELKVTDSRGLFTKDTIQVTVSSQSSPLPPCTTNCGKIVFVSDRDGNNEIYSCNADGSNVTRLTNNAAVDGDPVWSPDGTRIAFVRGSGSYGSYELGDIYIMNADGSNVVQRTFTGVVKNPAWLPDGTRLVFLDMNPESFLMVMDLTSGSVSKLPNMYGSSAIYGSSVDPDPDWSPDGTKIAFDSDWRAYDFMSDIFTISPDGSGLTLLTPTFSGDHDYWRPAWSPDGTRLSFTIRDLMAGADHGSIGVMSPDGTGLSIIRTGILMGSFKTTRTSWSPDGTSIAYTENKTIKWVAADGSAAETIIANGWDADWK